MNTISWTIIFQWRVEPFDLGFNVVYNQLTNWMFIMFVYWNTSFETSDDLVDALASKIDWEIFDVDISISTEDTVHMFKFEQIKWDYMSYVVEWKDINIADIIKRVDFYDVIAIREAELSELFGNRKIKVDILKMS